MVKHSLPVLDQLAGDYMRIGRNEERMTDANYLAGPPLSYVGFREPLCEHMLTTSLALTCYLLGCDYIIVRPAKSRQGGDA